MTYHDIIDTVRDITGLEFDRAELIYKACLDGDWSQIGTDELRTPEAPKDPDLRLKAFLEKGEKPTLRRQVSAAIIIERSKRETFSEAEEFFKNDDDSTA
jgi:hypothetical protein